MIKDICYNRVNKSYGTGMVISNRFTDSKTCMTKHGNYAAEMEETAGSCAASAAAPRDGRHTVRCGRPSPWAEPISFTARSLE